MALSTILYRHANADDDSYSDIVDTGSIHGNIFKLFVASISREYDDNDDDDNECDVH